ncbi:MAG: DNA polymerase III subunit delta [Flammeovirgaceae bacterium]|nr:DNA polymerase III subunit delta [Flammeovirgaceae bacterium]
MRYQDIPGLSHVKNHLVKSVQSGKVHHAQLFSGKEGALNLQLALAYAMYLHCENRTQDACGTCPACLKSVKHVHPDTHFVFPVSNIKNEKDAEKFKAEILKQWRSFLLEEPIGNFDDWTNYYGGENKQAIISKESSRDIIRNLALRPFESLFKVMIIWKPESMHASASNGILKILEEPANNTVFILVSNAADQLLPTILSRTQQIKVPLLSDDELEEELTKRTECDSSKISKIVQQAEGNLNLALRLTDSAENGYEETFTNWMRTCYERKYGELVQLAEEFHGYDKLDQKNFLNYSLNSLREVILELADAGQIHRSRDQELKFVQDFSKIMSIPKVDKATRLVNDAGYYLERNGSAKMIFLDLSLQLSNIINPK